MKLAQIFKQIKGDFSIKFNSEKLPEIEVELPEIDSRKIIKNSVFFALNGKATNGINFVESAIEKGASVIVANEIPQIFTQNSAKTSDVILILSKNPFTLLVEFLQIFYPNLPQNIYAVTGTNGKTSVAEFVRQMLEFIGKKSAAIGTLGVLSIHDIKGLESSSLTTPDIISLYKNLAVLKENNIDDVVFEASSIALEQQRMAGVKIAVGAFTNFTQDHLDYHNSMEEYLRCKTLLFSHFLENGVAVLNADIAEFETLKKVNLEHKNSVIDYGFKAQILQIVKIEKFDLNQRIFLKYKEEIFTFEMSQNADFQALNALCALGCILAKNDLSNEELKKLLANFIKLKPALGRMQQVATLPNKAQIFIDFAHTPDAVENVLREARKISKGRLIILFGCGGNRDKSKRPLMGKIASDLADLVIISDDNPRTENALAIRGEILAACNRDKTVEIEGRKAAIIKALAMLQENDILILAGKGHEKYQIIGEEKTHFDEEEIVKLNLAALNLG